MILIASVPGHCLSFYSEYIFPLRFSYSKSPKFMYKISNNECPPYINELFHERILHENVPTLRSSSTHSFITPRPYKEIFKQSLTYSGPIIWNSLSSGIKSLDSFTRWTKQAFPCSKFLSPGGQLWANTAFEGSQFYSIGVPKFYSWVNVNFCLRIS